MSTLEFDLATIRTQLTYLIDKLDNMPKAEKPEEPLPEHITLNKAVELKGGATLATYRSRQILQPCGGTNSVRVGGRKCWKKADILEWLNVDDEKLPEYLKKFGVTAK